MSRKDKKLEPYEQGMKQKETFRGETTQQSVGTLTHRLYQTDRKKSNRRK